MTLPEIECEGQECRLDHPRGIIHQDGERHYQRGRWYCTPCWAKQGEDWRIAAKRVAELLMVLGETMPMGTMGRAVRVAPAMETKDWANELAGTLMRRTRKDAQALVASANNSGISTPHRPSSRRSGVDPVTAFVFGAMFL